MRNFICCISLLFITFASFAKDYTPEMMPNVNLDNRYEFVSDPGNLLSPEVKAAVNKQLWNLRQSTSVEAVVAIPPSIGDETIEEWSEQLFTAWGIGKKDKDNGVLLVIAPEQRRARIQTGYGVEGALPDISCMNIINQDIVPNMKADNINAAVSAATSTICAALTDPAVADELRSSQPDNFGGEVISSEVVRKFAEFVAGIVFLISVFKFFSCMFKARKEDVYYHKAMIWRRSLPSFGWLSLFSFGAGLVTLFFAWRMYRHYRTKRIRCSTCGSKMKRLNEQEDNQLLSDSQDFEEQLGTVDYDVWECPTCGSVERFAYKTKQNKYTECPNCHTIAMCPVGTHTVTNPTYTHSGMGQTIFECKYCHHQKRTPFVIPKKESIAPVIAGAAIGAMSGRRGGGGFGGGGFGGGFGGGATGGGGASGGW